MKKSNRESLLRISDGDERILGMTEETVKHYVQMTEFGPLIPDYDAEQRKRINRELKRLRAAIEKLSPATRDALANRLFAAQFEVVLALFKDSDLGALEARESVVSLDDLYALTTPYAGRRPGTGFGRPRRILSDLALGVATNFHIEPSRSANSDFVELLRILMVEVKLADEDKEGDDAQELARQLAREILKNRHTP